MKANHRIDVYLVTHGQTQRELVEIGGNDYGDIVLTFAEGDGIQFTPREKGLSVPTVESVKGLYQNKVPRLSSIRVTGGVIFGDLRIIPRPEHAELDPATAGGALLPGWRLNKLTLKACPNGRKPGVFKYGILSYTVPGGKAWDTVCDLIRANAFDGHGVKMKTPNEHFKREHRSFFEERLAKNESGWFIKTL